MSSDPEKWNMRYREARAASAARVLVENAHLLPPTGTALDLACGLGENALVLAQRGLKTLAWDSSPVAIDKLRKRAQAQGTRVEATVRDVVERPPEPDRFDVIVVAHFLDRSLVESIINALRPAGLLFYQTFTRTRVGDQGPRNPSYLLADGELLSMFSSLKLLVYREEGLVGNSTRGFRGEAMLVGRKTSG
ncbi:MAG: class I SAM-dependent methyltransferase [Acidiferrobacterales bacterium]